jgi:hypothetical protein
MTVAKLAETVKIPADRALANLQQHGIVVTAPTMTLQQIADAHALTPQQVYQRLQSEDAKPSVSLAEGGGWGRMNVEQVCERLSVTVDRGVERLRAAGFEASASTAIRELATASGQTPIDIARVVAGEDRDVTPPSAHGPAGGPNAGVGVDRPGQGDR